MLIEFIFSHLFVIYMHLSEFQSNLATSSSNGSSDGIGSRVVEGQTHDSLKPNTDNMEANKDHIQTDHTQSSDTDHPSSSKVHSSSRSDCLVVGSTYKFRLTVLQASHVPSDYADIFCQFK